MQALLNAVSAATQEAEFLPWRWLPAGLVERAPSNGAASVSVWAAVWYISYLNILLLALASPIRDWSALCEAIHGSRVG